MISGGTPVVLSNMTTLRLMHRCIFVFSWCRNVQIWHCVPSLFFSFFFLLSLLTFLFVENSFLAFGYTLTYGLLFIVCFNAFLLLANLIGIICYQPTRGYGHFNFMVLFFFFGLGWVMDTNGLETGLLCDRG